MNRYLSYMLTAGIIFLGCFLNSCVNSSINWNNYKDIISHKGEPENIYSRKPLPFSDEGSWMGFSLHSDSIASAIGPSFIGPFLFDENQWGCTRWAQLKSEEAPISWKVNSYSIPGALLMNFSSKQMRGTAKLFFIDSKTSIILYQFDQAVNQNFRLNFSITSDNFIFDTANGIFNLNDWELRVKVLSDRGPLRAKRQRDGIYFRLPKGIRNIIIIQSLSSERDGQKPATITLSQNEIDSLWKKNRSKWTTYLNRAFRNIRYSQNDPGIKLLVVKAVCTLINNWKSAHGDLKHDGIFPSSGVWYFNGFWAWDSWKHAVAAVRFHPELAKNQMRAMFDYQAENGMIPDVIYANKKENNWRDSKPPLAGWALYEIFTVTKDTQFVAELLPGVIKYHEWWYKDRDHDNDGVCEYGSTDGTLEAARWESGMDNAVRFDRTKMIKNGKTAYSMDQESVDLNAYLLMEKQYIARLMKIVGDDSLSELYQQDYLKNKNKISQFWDSDEGYFYDTDLEGTSHIRVKGPEGWIPLFGKLAEKSQAEGIKHYMLSKEHFNTFIPLPTLEKGHPKFNPEGYWRGPVWLDQFYFGIKGLLNYGYKKEATSLLQKFLNNAKGLFKPGFPIHENYHPLTGEALKAPHFSWSAAHILLLLEENYQ